MTDSIFVRSVVYLDVYRGSGCRVTGFSRLGDHYVIQP